MSAVRRALYGGSVAYCLARGFSATNHDWAAITASPIVGAEIAREYLDTPDERDNPVVLNSYRALVQETWQQYRFLTGALGVRVIVQPEDPYENAEALHAELATGTLRVWATSAGDNPHPLMSDEENDAFRAVHDAFGHGSIGLGFDPDGEEAAWVKHRQMFSLRARGAMTTETRGQTMTMYFGPKPGVFAEQKALLLPEHFWSPEAELPTPLPLHVPAAAYWA